MTPGHKAELARICERIVRPRDVRSYLEIGVRNGISLAAIGDAMRPGGIIVGVDLPGGRWGVEGSEKAFCGQAERLQNEHGHVVEPTLGDSHGEEVQARVQALIDKHELAGPRPFDLVFIDGDHTYDGVKADWEAYGQLGKVVVFDDIAQDTDAVKHTAGEVLSYGVSQLWHELEAGALFWDTETIVAPPSRNGKGVLVWHDG